MKLFDQSLKARGLAVVLIPIFLQIITSIWLYAEFINARNMALNASSNKEILLKTQEIQKNVGDAVFSIFIVSGSQGLIGRDYFEESMQGIRRDIAQLQTLAAGNDEFVALLKKLEPISSTLENLMAQTDKLGQKEMRALSGEIPFEKEKLKDLEGFHQVALGLTNIVEKSDKEKYLNVDAERQKLRIVFIFVLAVSAVTSAAMALLYGIKIESRLQKVAKNADVLLSKNRSNENIIPVDGTDEIALFNRQLASVEASIREAKEKEQALIREASALIISLDKDLQISFANDASYRFLGLMPEELERRGLNSICGQDDSVSQQLKTVISNKEAARFEATLITLEGSAIDTEWSVTWSELEGLLFCVVQDISEQKAVEKLREQFIQTVGRDIAQPMEALRLNLQQLHRGDKGELSDKVKLEISRSASNMSRLTRLLNDIVDMDSLSIAKISVMPEWCSAKNIVNKSFDAIRAAADVKKIQLVQRYESEAEVFADADRVIQILVNLLSNAIKFSSESSNVTVEVSKLDQQTLFSVVDTGKGIPADRQSSVFKPFERLSEDTNVSQGAGLGLSICKIIVESHGGNIGVESEPGKGSKFYFSLPDGPCA